LLETIAGSSGATLEAAVFFGSRSSGVATTSASAYDLMLVCEEPKDFYAMMHREGLLQRSPRVLALLDPFLPPTQIRLSRTPWVVKASVVSARALRHATSPDRKDQFLAGRLFQDVHVVWARTMEASARLDDAIQSARELTVSWVAPDLPPTFDAAVYLRQLFRTSFRFEVRPETRGRADALFAAQATRLTPIFEEVVDHLASKGLLIRNADATFALPRPPTFAERFRLRIFLEWSRVRATARWPKHALSFDGWLDYIIRKAERHSGETIVLTSLERRVPFIFLWPRVVRFLLRQRSKGRTV
jgi:hypothetical protein